MAILKLVGAKRFMHKRASQNVIELDGLTDDIKDEKLVQALLNTQRVGADNKAHPVFALVENAEPTQNTEPAEGTKSAVKKKASVKKKARARKRAGATDTQPDAAPE